MRTKIPYKISASTAHAHLFEVRHIKMGQIGLTLHFSPISHPPKNGTPLASRQNIVEGIKGKATKLIRFWLIDHPLEGIEPVGLLLEHPFFLILDIKLKSRSNQVVYLVQSKLYVEQTRPAFPLFPKKKINSRQTPSFIKQICNIGTQTSLSLSSLWLFRNRSWSQPLPE